MVDVARFAACLALLLVALIIAPMSCTSLVIGPECLDITSLEINASGSYNVRCDAPVRLVLSQQSDVTVLSEVTLILTTPVRALRFSGLFHVTNLSIAMAFSGSNFSFWWLADPVILLEGQFVARSVTLSMLGKVDLVAPVPTLFQRGPGALVTTFSFLLTGDLTCTNVGAVLDLGREEASLEAAAVVIEGSLSVFYYLLAGSSSLLNAQFALRFEQLVITGAVTVSTCAFGGTCTGYSYSLIRGNEFQRLEVTITGVLVANGTFLVRSVPNGPCSGASIDVLGGAIVVMNNSLVVKIDGVGLNMSVRCHGAQFVWLSDTKFVSSKLMLDNVSMSIVRTTLMMYVSSALVSTPSGPYIVCNTTLVAQDARIVLENSSLIGGNTVENTIVNITNCSMLVYSNPFGLLDPASSAIVAARTIRNVTAAIALSSFVLWGVTGGLFAAGEILDLLSLDMSGSTVACDSRHKFGLVSSTSHLHRVSVTLSRTNVDLTISAIAVSHGIVASLGFGYLNPSTDRVAIVIMENSNVVVHNGSVVCGATISDTSIVVDSSSSLQLLSDGALSFGFRPFANCIHCRMWIGGQSAVTLNGALIGCQFMLQHSLVRLSALENLTYGSLGTIIGALGSTIAIVNTTLIMDGFSFGVPPSAGWLMRTTPCSASGLVDLSAVSIELTGLYLRSKTTELTAAGTGVLVAPTAVVADGVTIHIGRNPRRRGNATDLQWTSTCQHDVRVISITNTIPAALHVTSRTRVRLMSMLRAAASLTVTAAVVRGLDAVATLSAQLQVSVELASLIAHCASSDPSDSPLVSSSLLENPFQVSISSARDLMFAAGAVIANVAVCASWLGAGLTVIIVWKARSTGKAVADMIRKQLVRHVLPLLLTPYAFLLQPSVAAATSLLVVGGDLSIALGVVGAVLWLAPIVAMGYQVLAKFQCEAHRVQQSASRFSDPMKSGVKWRIVRMWQMVLNPMYEWKSTTSRPNDESVAQLERYGPLFAGFRRGRHWYLALDYGYAAVTATLAGWAAGLVVAGSSCQSQTVTSVMWALAALSVVMLLLEVRLRPRNVRFDEVNVTVNDVVTCAVAVMSALQDESLNNTITALVLIQSCYGLLTALIAAPRRLMSHQPEGFVSPMRTMKMQRKHFHIANRLQHHSGTRMLEFLRFSGLDAATPASREVGSLKLLVEAICQARSLEPGSPSSLQ